MKKLCWVICDKYRNPKISYIFEKKYFFLLFAESPKMKMKNYLKKKN